MMTNKERVAYLTWVYRQRMYHLALVRTVGVVFVVLCWMFTIYSALSGLRLP